MEPTRVSPWIARGLYLFAVALLLTAVIDLGSTVWPFRPGEVTWRYGFLGLMAGYLQTPTLGLTIALAVALWQESRTMLRVLGTVGLLAAAALLLAVGMFALDVIQMRGMRVDEIQSSVLTGGMLQEVKYVVASVVLVLLGLGAMGTAKRLGKG